MIRTLYKLTDSTNGLCYIGSTRHLEKRIASHRNPNKFRNSPIVKRIREIGFGGFTVSVLVIGDEADILALETATIRELNTTYPNGYNWYGYGVVKRQVMVNFQIFPDLVTASKITGDSVKSIKSKIFRKKDGFKWL